MFQQLKEAVRYVWVAPLDASRCSLQLLDAGISTEVALNGDSLLGQQAGVQVVSGFPLNPSLNANLARLHVTIPTNPIWSILSPIS